MGIEEFVINRAERIGEIRGEKRGEKIGEKRAEQIQGFNFVKALLKETDFNDEKIAMLASVKLEFVDEVRKKL